MYVTVTKPPRVQVYVMMARPPRIYVLQLQDLPEYICYDGKAFQSTHVMMAWPPQVDVY